MANISSVLLFFSLAVVLASLANAARTIKPNIENDSPFATRNYTKVCDPARFSDLGLDMNDFLYCDSSIEVDMRIKDLIDRMTLQEKALQLGDDAKGVIRIGLPEYKWWSEALHGVSDVGGGSSFDEIIPGATSFPTPILSAATFNETLWKAIGQAVSTEARAMHNLEHAGMTFWSPNINVVRDPRWGRALETPGEDPLVVGKYASNYVRGLQDIQGQETSEDPKHRPLKVAACCKHYAAYDVDNWVGVIRETYNAKVEERDMIETFQKPFEMCVLEGDVASVMCSYNQVNGLPTCADPQLLKETVRGKWDLNGYIVSDCDSVEVMVDRQRFLGYSPEDAVAQVLRAGLDLDCGKFSPDHVANAVLQGKIRVSDVDVALKNLYRFDNLGKDDVCTEENINLAIQAAREGMVLLKNEDQTLPLNLDEIKSLAVVGPHANATTVMIGNYAGIPCRYTSPLDAFKEATEVIYEVGCDTVSCKNESLIFPAMQAAQNTDATVLVVGIDLSIEAESLDRRDLLLPGYQRQLIEQVAMSAKGPVILVVMSAGGVDIEFAKNNPNIKAIIWAGYAGEEGGHGIADVVFGKYNPSGRLPLTWHENDYVNMLPMISMPLRPIDSLGYPGRTYKFYNGSVVYPFGYGLSYTTFNYNVEASKKMLDVNLDKFIKCRDLNYTQGVAKPSCPAVLIDDLSDCQIKINDLEFSVEVENTGDRDGSEAVLVYWVAPNGILDAPIKQLVAFQKVFVEAGRSTKVDFKLCPTKDLGLIDFQAYNLLAAGTHTIILGDNVASFPFSINIHNSEY
ncbi:hypothetical protein M9H77_11252 [Catharanthus roseus]|uniref:Uncharacterized protein n=1 Tax=Catharanthus roseus TaxID=4058 RepID=A0ACC0BE39_CATRO|nr:hypothetical protein M9H77_11252 [Catharanthus roseus]